MARLGIDFGTTNTVVVLYDRGRYPVVPHSISTLAGEVVDEVFPSTIWVDRNRGEWLFGLEAERRARRSNPRDGSAYITSLKRELKYYAEGQSFPVGNGPPISMKELLVRFLKALRRSIIRSTCARPGPHSGPGGIRPLTN